MVYTVRLLREKLKEALDTVAKGGEVVIKRNKERFQIIAIVADSPYLGKAVSPDLGFANGVDPVKIVQFKGHELLCGEYGCGCQKTDAKLCKKHNRT